MAVSTLKLIRLHMMQIEKQLFVQFGKGLLQILAFMYQKIKYQNTLNEMIICLKQYAFGQN